jgi:hypothetical protein
MEEPYAEGVAIYGGPELCVGDPRGRSEALVRGTHRPDIGKRSEFPSDDGCSAGFFGAA